MALFPFRNLGAIGTITDVDPLALPPGAWSASANMRFTESGIERAPHFRRVGTLTAGTPSFLYGTRTQRNGSEFLVAMSDGRIERWSAKGRDGGPGQERDLTEKDWRPYAYVTEPTTATELQDVIYLNRPDRPLWAMQKGGERFTLAPGWNEDWRCKAVRSIQGQVVALGVSRNGRFYPAMVKFSDLAVFAAPALNWIADTTNSAGENILGNLAEGLVDGLELRGRLYLYAQHGVYAMTPRPDAFIFDFAPIFNDKGVISPNCLAEAQNIHYVFGLENLWAHDGTSELWSTSGTLSRDIFDHLVLEARHRFFVFHNWDRQEIMFCHVSEHPDCKFKVGPGNVPNDLDPYPGCNRSATYCYRTKTWAFDDLPYVIGAATVQPSTGTRWEELGPTTWAEMKAAKTTWLDLLDRNPPVPLMVSPVRTVIGEDPARIVVANDDTLSLTRSADDLL